MSRPKRWSAAVSKAQSAFDALEAAIDDLKDIQSEYQDWLDNLPENLQSGPLYEKLEAVCDLDLDILDDISEAIAGAQDADLPLGFGKD